MIVMNRQLVMVSPPQMPVPLTRMYNANIPGSYEQRKQTRTTEQAKTNLYMKIHGIKYL